MKPSSQGCRIGKKYKMIDVSTKDSNGIDYLSILNTCFSSPPLVWRNGPYAMYTELDYDATCKQCGKSFREH